MRRKAWELFRVIAEVIADMLVFVAMAGAVMWLCCVLSGYGWE